MIEIKKLEKPIISPDFTLDDIRKIRDYNSARHLIMTQEQLKAESEEIITKFRDEMKSLFGKEIHVI